MARSIADLREDAKSQFQLDFEIAFNEGAEKSAPVSEQVKGNSKESTSEAITEDMKIQGNSCSNIDSQVEKLMKKMLYGTVSIDDIFELVDLELEWRILNNQSPKFRKTRKAWQRVQEKVNRVRLISAVSYGQFNL